MFDLYPRGFTGHVAHPSRSIVSQLPPAVFALYLEALPDMSLTPVAPFAVANVRGQRLAAHDYTEVATDLALVQRPRGRLSGPDLDHSFLVFSTSEAPA